MMRLDAATGDLLRELAPQVLGVLARRSGDFAASEDAVQEALLAAAQHWPAEGRPDNPRGWLIQVASRRLTDQIRSEQARRRREDTAAIMEPAPPQPDDQDDTLQLLFLCCHPDLTAASAIALTLRAIGGLTTAEIASAFLVPEATVAQRISRAKARIKSSGAGFTMPTVKEWEPRLRSVLRVLYLIFNEGYARSGGQGVYRTELSAEAIRLARMMHALVPADNEIAGLLALMLLTDARRPARTGPDGELVPLPTQRRELWNREQISEGVRLITSALRADVIGEYQAQAAIAAIHDDAQDAAETDWPQILYWYGELERLTGNPVVTLNRAVALAMTSGPASGLALLTTVDDQLAGHYRLDAVRAHLHEMAGDKQLALRHFRAAAARTTSTAEQQYLLTQAARLGRET
ncbi:MAG TPA: sigma-70 family RNA polymerase sigma factor [Frankiaceae bacterium]|jgi:RNA polymerase sigma factor (sigma-70 family)|nr:sigma-70 family RNA polymerase sigma factor [Frankiaceae bacterium]